MRSVKLIAMAVVSVSFVWIGNVFADFAQILPEFSLQDPSGKTFTRDSISQNGVVLVVTAPTLGDEKVQEGWDKYLSRGKTGSKCRYVYVEDLQQSMFKDKATEGMKKNYISGQEPILLIDTHGTLRRALGVSAKKTVVLVYDRDGKLVHSETRGPSAHSAATIWGKV